MSDWIMNTPLNWIGLDWYWIGFTHKSPKSVQFQRRILNPVKNLNRSLLREELTAFSRVNIISILAVFFSVKFLI